MTIEQVKDTAEYFGAAMAVALKAARDESPQQVEFEEPYPCEDGKTFWLRGWTPDGRDYSARFEPSAGTDALSVDDAGGPGAPPGAGPPAVIAEVVSVQGSQSTEAR